MSLDTARAVAVLRGLTGKLMIGFKAGNPFFPTVCMRAGSQGSDEQYGMLGAVPQMREWLGERKVKTLRAAHMTVVNKHFEATIGVLKNDLNDDRMGLYDTLAEDIGQRAKTHPDTLLFELIRNGGSLPCFDGQYFFDTDHAFGASGAQSNAITSVAADIDAPTVAELKTAFQAAILKLLSYKDDQGEPLSQPTVDRISNLVLVVPVNMRQVAYEAFESLIISSSTNVVIDRPQIVCSPTLTDLTQFYVFQVGQPVKPFIFQERQGLQSGWSGLDDIMKKEVAYGVDARYAMAYGAWWMAVRVTFALS